jgi:D-alanine-D-alanine ligase
MGGPSSERAISLKSGKAVCQSLAGAGFNAIAIDIHSDKFGENSRLLKSHNIDCAFLALHGRFGEDGQIQGLLDALRIPYTGSGAKASRLAMDKISSRSIFKEHGLNVPLCNILRKKSYKAGRASSNLSLPLVVKPATHGSSIGLSIVDRLEDLDAAIELAFGYDERIIVEEYIKGREVTVGILDEQPLPVIEIIPRSRFFDYEAKYKVGMTDYIVPAKLNKTLAEDIKSVGLTAHKLLKCSGCSRVDMILSNDKAPFVLEVNTIPGLTETSLLPKAAKTVGIDFLELCLKLIELAYAKKKS